MNETIKPRINKFDNLKGLAIILIIMGHITITNDFIGLKILKCFIYIFHLPIFFFVAGYFSKIGPKEPIKAVKRILIPYILFSVIYGIYYLLVFNTSKIFFFDPYFGLWFLISLFTMKIFLPILDKLKYPLITTFIIALLIPFIPIDNILGITRTFSYLPVFLIGFYYNNYKNKLMKYSVYEIFNNKIIKYILCILVLIACIIVSYKFSFKVIQLTQVYPTNNIIHIIKRAIVIILGILVVLILNNIMTNKKIVLTKIGKNSMAVYLLHLFVYSIFTSILYKYSIFSNTVILFIFIILSSFSLAWILSRDPITKYLNKVTDGIYDLIFKPIE